MGIWEWGIYGLQTSKECPPPVWQTCKSALPMGAVSRDWDIIRRVHTFFTATINTIFSSHSAVPTLTVNLITSTTRFPNMAPYNTFFINCTATSSVEGVGNVALPKKFLWRRRYGPDTTGLTQLSSNDTIQIQDGDNLTQPTSYSILTVTEDIPRDYRYHCQVDLDLSADNISSFTDAYPINVTGM